MQTYFLKLFAYHEWATQAVWQAALPYLDTEDYFLSLFSHLFNAQHIWLCRLENRKSEFGTWEKHLPQKLTSLFDSNQQEWLNYLQKTDESQMSRMVTYTNSQGKEFSNAVMDITAHVLNHGTHHRGQINKKLRELGITPPAIDYIFYCRQ